MLTIETNKWRVQSFNEQGSSRDGPPESKSQMENRIKEHREQGYSVHLIFEAVKVTA